MPIPESQKHLRPTVRHVIKALEELTLHEMSKVESERLHELLDMTRIGIEEAWMRWDDQRARYVG